jgi:prepilin-type N-terminal cleavage/methylation domain-containing protein
MFLKVVSPQLPVSGNKRVFTLLELMVALLVLGVLATLAVSHLAVSREKAFLKGALGGLKILQAAEKVRFAESGSFVACSGALGSGTSCYEVLKIDLFGFPSLFDYSVGGVSATDFSAQFQRSGGSFNTCVYVINATQTDTVYSAGTCP